jgi:hypothetical protein
VKFDNNEKDDTSQSMLHPYKVRNWSRLAEDAGVVAQSFEEAIHD